MLLYELYPQFEVLHKVLVFLSKTESSITNSNRVHSNFMELAFFAIRLIGKEGSIIVDSGIFDHNTNLDPLSDEGLEKLKNEQYFTIGVENEPITKEQTEEFLQALHEYMCKDEFDNDVNYDLVDIEKIGSKLYVMSWL